MLNLRNKVSHYKEQLRAYQSASEGRASSLYYANLTWSGNLEKELSAVFEQLVDVRTRAEEDISKLKQERNRLQSDLVAFLFSSSHL